MPHGYLSDSEGDHSGDEGTRGQDDQVGEGLGEAGVWLNPFIKCTADCGILLDW